MVEVKEVRLTECIDTYMTVLLFRQKARKYYLTVNGEDSREYTYHLWYLQKIPVLFRISKFVNTVLAKRCIKQMGGTMK